MSDQNLEHARSYNARDTQLFTASESCAKYYSPNRPSRSFGCADFLPTARLASSSFLHTEMKSDLSDRGSTWLSWSLWTVHPRRCRACCPSASSVG
eukprot:3893017-Pleurochrysis_carterae.AAC.1